jgi:hypothetical protein
VLSVLLRFTDSDNLSRNGGCCYISTGNANLSKNAPFNNISAISGQSVLLVEESGMLGENHRLVTDKLRGIEY